MGKLRRVLECVLLLMCGASFAAGTAGAEWFSLPDAALMSSEFATAAWGPATYTRTDVLGPGVRYDFTGLSSSATGIRDNYPVMNVYDQNGGSDFTNFDSYNVTFINLSDSGYVHVNIFFNTGLTQGSDGGHTHSGICDTYWEDGWIFLEAGDTVEVLVEFDAAVAWNISDNPIPHSEGGNGSPDGGTYTINAYDRGQVTNIGFQVADFDGESPNASLLIKATWNPELPAVGPDGIVALAVVLVLVALGLWRFRSRGVARV